MTALEILQAINSKFPGAVIAGGYVRDTVLGVEPKDIDVYIHAPGDAWETEAALREAVQAHTTEMLGSSGETTDTDFRERLTAVFKVYRTAEANIDVLFFNEPIAPDASNVLASFDVALCQAAMLPNGEIVSTPGFKSDVAWNELTILRASDHAERLVGKFPKRNVSGPRLIEDPALIF
jgi:hypothetical protein